MFGWIALGVSKGTEWAFPVERRDKSPTSASRITMKEYALAGIPQIAADLVMRKTISRELPGCPKRKYSEAELATLDYYGWHLGWSARQIHTAVVLPNRSYHSISKKMGRLAYGDPLRVQRAKEAKRLTDVEYRRLKEFLLNDGRQFQRNHRPTIQHLCEGLQCLSRVTQ